jgi:hypothetical protein
MFFAEALAAHDGAEAMMSALSAMRDLARAPTCAALPSHTLTSALRCRRSLVAPQEALRARDAPEPCACARHAAWGRAAMRRTWTDCRACACGVCARITGRGMPAVAFGLEDAWALGVGVPGPPTTLLLPVRPERDGEPVGAREARSVIARHAP